MNSSIITTHVYPTFLHFPAHTQQSTRVFPASRTCTFSQCFPFRDLVNGQIMGLISRLTQLLAPQLFPIPYYGIWEYFTLGKSRETPVTWKHVRTHLSRWISIILLEAVDP